jgi:hypothetical protein
VAEEFHGCSPTIPDDISIPLYDRMCAAKLLCFVGVEGCVNSSEHHIRAPSACNCPKLVAAESIGCVDADADNIASLNASWVQSRKGFIDKRGIAKSFRGCCREHI